MNRHGLFNVPYGSQAHTSFFQPTIVRAAHRALQGAEIFCEDFEACAGRVRPGDFVYLDPPYAAALRDGWYVTGDIVVMQREGFVVWLRRAP